MEGAGDLLRGLAQLTSVTDVRCAHELERGGGGKKRSHMLQRKVVTVMVTEVEMGGN